MNKGPAVILYDSSGTPLAVQDGVAIPVSTPALLAAGSDGANARFLRVAADGTVRVDPTGTTTQPVSASALPLPAGAATEATLATRATEATVATLATEATASTLGTEATLATRASEATLATRATEATLTTRVADATITARLNVLGQNTMAASAPVVLASDQTSIPIDDDGGSITIDAVSLPLPTGAATEATLATRATEATVATLGTEATLSTRASEATLATRSSEATLSTRVADATITARLNTLGQNTMAASAPVVIASDQSSIPVDDDGGSITVDAVSWPLPTGASTEATLATRLAEATFTGRINTLGQKTMANSTPVVISSDQSALIVAQATAANLQAQVQGTAADGAASSGNPVHIGGKDNAGNMQSIFCDVFGNQRLAGKQIDTYAAATALFSPAATPTDIFVLTGSASKTVRLLRLILSGTQSSSGSTSNISLVKRSTDDTGGTSVAATHVPLDSAFAAATAVARHYTANPTLGALVGTILQPRLLVASNATDFNPTTIFDFSQDLLNGQPITLRGVAEVLAVNLGGVTLTGAANFQISCFWSEE